MSRVPSAAWADARRRDAGDVGASSRSDNEADAHAAPEPIKGKKVAGQYLRCSSSTMSPQCLQGAASASSSRLDLGLQAPCARHILILGHAPSVWYDEAMIWFGVWMLLAAQAGEPVSPTPVPEAPGIYYLQQTRWIMLQPALVADANAKGMELFVYTGGYTDLGMNIACQGDRAAIRIRDARPVFHVRNIGAIQDAMLIRMKKKKNSRVLKTSFSNVTVDNKGGFKKGDVFNLSGSEQPGGVVSLSPEKPLPPGEYLLVFGNASKAYDFGIDKSN